MLTRDLNTIDSRVRRFLDGVGFGVLRTLGIEVGLSRELGDGVGFLRE